MKKRSAFIIVGSVLIASVFTGCTSIQNVYGMSSDSLSGSVNSNDPSLSVAAKGFHPYLGASYADKQSIGSVRESIETFHAESVGAGVYYQPSLTEDRVFGSFFNASLSGSSVSYTPRFTNDQKESIASMGVSNGDHFTDYSVQFVGKPGFLVKRNNALLSVCLLGIVRYENGDYSSFRKKLDQVDSLYNLSDSAVTYGFGYGISYQYGNPDQWDIGISLESSAMINKTQSVSYAYLTNDSDTVLSSDGDVYRKTSLKIEPFVDYKHCRFSVAVINAEKVSYSVTYRF